MELKPNFIRIGITFNTVLFPLTLSEMYQSLEKLGYEMSPSLPSPPPPGRITGTGEIARKGRTTIIIDSSAQSLRVADISKQSAIEALDSIAEILQKDFGVDINEFARFYDLYGEYVYPTEKRCYETIAKTFKASIFDKIEEIMEEEIWPLELRFGGAKLSVNSENWFDILIRPNFERNDSYVLTVVFRNNDIKRWQMFMKGFEKRMMRILKLIDR